MLKRVRKALPRVPTQRIEKGVWVLGLWGSMLIFNLVTFLSRVFTQVGLTTKLLFTSTLEQMKRLKNWLYKEERLQTFMVRVKETLTSWLLLLTLVVGLYAVALPLLLSLSGLTAILIKLYQVVTKLRTSISKKFSSLKGLSHKS